MAEYSIIWNFDLMNKEQQGKRARIFNEKSVRRLIHKFNFSKVHHENFLRIEILHSIKKYSGHELSGTILLVNVNHLTHEIICNYKRVNDGGASIDMDAYGNSRFDFVYKYFYEDRNCLNMNTNKFGEFCKGYGIKLRRIKKC